MRLIRKYGIINTYLRKRPETYDRSRLLKDKIFENPKPHYRVFKKLNQLHSGNINLIQIGANDGLRNDPLRDFIVRYNWKGILVEPIPHSFESLKKNYAYLERSGLGYENAAIGSNGCEKLKFWAYCEAFLNTLATEEKRDRLRRKSSFSKDHVLAFLPKNADPESSITSIDVEVITLKTLLERHRFDQHIHLLAVDAEGYDHKIVQMALDENLQPDIIFFESLHLKEKKDLFENLRNQGYTIREYKNDTLVVKSTLEELLL